MIRLLLRLCTLTILACVSLIVVTIAAGNALSWGDQLVMSVNWLNGRWRTQPKMMIVDLDRGLRAGLDRHVGHLQNIEHLEWSPDGRYLAFSASQTPPDRDIFVLDFQTMQVQQQTSFGFATDSPTWSPDGTRIAFATNYDRVPSVYEVTVDLARPPRAPRIVSEMFGLRRVMGLDWSPSGDLLYSDDRAVGILSLNPDTGRSNIVFNVPFAYQVSISPDGARVCFMAPISPRASGSGLYFAPRDGSTLTEVMTNGRSISSEHPPVWSPDGSRIAYTSFDPSGTSVYQTTIFTTDLGSGATDSLYVMPPDSSPRSLDWRPR